MRLRCYSGFFAAIALVSGCLPVPKAVDPNARVNAGVNILPDAVLAAQKYPPSNRPTDNSSADLIDVISDSDQNHFDMIELLRKSGLVPTLQSVGPYTGCWHPRMKRSANCHPACWID